MDGARLFVFSSKKPKKKQISFLGRANKKSFYHDFGDGWAALVTAELVDARTARNRRKNTLGFNGYEWMIDDIIKHGKINPAA
jgi:hypothetical protein